MVKRVIALLLLVCIFGCLLGGCKNKITAEEAVQIVLTELGATKPDESPHVHNSTYNGKDCFNVFVTVNGSALVYIVSDTGEILAHGPSSHSH